MSRKSLNFISKEIITDEGVYHYQKEDGTTGVRGSLLDNSYLLLLYTEAYEVLEDEQYLIEAQRIAQHSLNDLYNWNGGGFFERNSPDTENYAPGEHMDFSKPTEENGIISFAFLKLYRQTESVEYLSAGLSTLGRIMSRAGGLDTGYYVIKAAQFASQEDLLAEYKANEKEIEQIEQEKLQQFWADELVAGQNSSVLFTTSSEGLENLDGPVTILMMVAFIAGLLSFLSPCTLPILPAFVAYTFELSKRNVKGMAFSFFLGLAVVFSALGMSATFLGNFLKSNITIFSQLAGILIIFFGFYILLGKGFVGFKIKQNKPTSYASAFVFGSILGLSWTPCIGPILAAILLLASTSASGGLLLFSYTVGLALPLILFSSYLSKLDKEAKIWKIIRGKELQFTVGSKEIMIHTTALISGLLFIVIGYLIFSGLLFIFNQYIVASAFQKWIFSIEHTILGLVG